MAFNTSEEFLEEMLQSGLGQQPIREVAQGEEAVPNVAAELANTIYSSENNRITMPSVNPGEADKIFEIDPVVFGEKLYGLADLIAGSQGDEARETMVPLADQFLGNQDMSLGVFLSTYMIPTHATGFVNFGLGNSVSDVLESMDSVDLDHFSEYVASRDNAEELKTLFGVEELTNIPLNYVLPEDGRESFLTGQSTLADIFVDYVLHTNEEFGIDVPGVSFVGDVPPVNETHHTNVNDETGYQTRGDEVPPTEEEGDGLGSDFEDFAQAGPSAKARDDYEQESRGFGAWVSDKKTAAGEWFAANVGTWDDVRNSPIVRGVAVGAGIAALIGVTYLATNKDDSTRPMYDSTGVVASAGGSNGSTNNGNSTVAQAGQGGAIVTPGVIDDADVYNAPDAGSVAPPIADAGSAPAYDAGSSGAIATPDAGSPAVTGRDVAPSIADAVTSPGDVGHAPAPNAPDADSTIVPPPVVADAGSAPDAHQPGYDAGTPAQPDAGVAPQPDAGSAPGYGARTAVATNIWGQRLNKAVENGTALETVAGYICNRGGELWVQMPSSKLEGLGPIEYAHVAAGSLVGMMTEGTMSYDKDSTLAEQILPIRESLGVRRGLAQVGRPNGGEKHGIMDHVSITVNNDYCKSLDGGN